MNDLNGVVSALGSRQIKTLLIAEAANPEWTSVPLIGWSLSRAIAKIADAHLVTHVRNRDAICRAGLQLGRDFTVIDNEHISAPVWRLGERLRGGAGKGWTTMTALSALSYYSFEREVWAQMGERLKSREFDLVHRITPLSPTHQSLLAKRLAKFGIPFVVGPLNGGVPWPPGFSDFQHRERDWLTYARSLYKILPHFRNMRKYSAVLIAGSSHTLGELQASAQAKCCYIPENGIDPGRFSAVDKAPHSLPLLCAFVGRLVPYKGADILIQASEKFLRNGKLELHVIGDGPERGALEGLADQLGVRSKVHFHGWVPHTELHTALAKCDLLGLPSVREFGGGVVLEAMAMGLPPIVADYAGPAELVDDASGIRVPFSSKESLVAGFERALERVIAEPSLLDALRRGGIARVREGFTWDAKARQILEIYKQVVRS